MGKKSGSTTTTTTRGNKRETAPTTTYLTVDGVSSTQAEIIMTSYQAGIAPEEIAIMIGAVSVEQVQQTICANGGGEPYCA